MQLVEFEGDDYCSAMANNADEAKKLIEVGFEYVCNHGDVMIFRKRKYESNNLNSQYSYRVLPLPRTFSDIIQDSLATFLFHIAWGSAAS